MWGFGMKGELSLCVSGSGLELCLWSSHLSLLPCCCLGRLSVKHTRTLQLDEDVLCVSYSPNQKLLAVSLLDCTVKVFYVDTLKVQWFWLGIIFLCDLGIWDDLMWLFCFSQFLLCYPFLLSLRCLFFSSGRQKGSGSGWEEKLIRILCEKRIYFQYKGKKLDNTQQLSIFLKIVYQKNLRVLETPIVLQSLSVLFKTSTSSHVQKICRQKSLSCHSQQLQVLLMGPIPKVSGLHWPQNNCLRDTVWADSEV